MFHKYFKNFNPSLKKRMSAKQMLTGTIQGRAAL